MKISLTTEGLLDPAKLRAWSLQKQDRIRTAVGVAMKTEGRTVARRANDAARSRFKARKRNFPGIYAKLFDKDKNRMPSLLIGSKIPWLGIHERGGVVSGKLLIPFGDQRIGPKKWRQTIANLMRSGNAYFRNVRGRAILFAENQAENRAELARFKRQYRKALGGGRIKKGADIPVATLVSSVNLRARLGLTKTVRSGVGDIVRGIQKTIDRTL